MTRRGALLVAALVTGAACQGGAPDALDPAASTAAASASTAAASTAVAAATIGPAATADPTIPAVGAPGGTGPVGSVPPAPVLSPATQAWLDAVPGWLADPATVPADAFDPTFLAAVPIEEVRRGLATLGGGPWTLSDIQPLSDTAAVAVVQGSNRALQLQLETTDAGLISTLFFENAGLAEVPATMAELLQRVEAAGERSGLVRAEIAPDGTCVPTVDRRADENLPIASAFKLYVLAALGDAIAAGRVTWDQPVTIRDALDSPGGGDTAAQPDGSTATVRVLAQRMIEVSDNTATDHLIDLLGRGAVEAALADHGHHDPASTLPLMTTREMSVVKADPQLLARYQSADEAGRRGMLAGEVAAAPTPTELWPEPRAVLNVEWFASPMDLCRVLADLDDAASTTALAPLGEILSANPGLIVDPTAFTVLRFKGGAEPGVLFGAWLGVRPDGSRVVAAGGAAATGHDIDPALIELVGAALTVPG